MDNLYLSAMHLLISLIMIRQCAAGYTLIGGYSGTYFRQGFSLTRVGADVVWDLSPIYIIWHKQITCNALPNRMTSCAAS
jgi:hypothetical protein